jgi:uncharacterized membrane protein
MSSLFRNPLQTFLAGLLALLPLALTVAAVIWVGNLVHTLVGPGSSMGQLLVSIGLAFAMDEAGAYFLGFLVVILCIFVFGVLVQSGMKSRLQAMGDRVFRKVPFIGSLYDLSHRFISIFDRQEGKDIKNMSPVWCFFGGHGGTAVLALMPSDELVELNGRSYRAILVPTAPIPFGGGLLFVPAEWVLPAAFGVEAFTSVYVSMGVTAPHFARTRRDAESPEAFQGRVGGDH